MRQEPRSPWPRPADVSSRLVRSCEQPPRFPATQQCVIRAEWDRPGSISVSAIIRKRGLGIAKVRNCGPLIDNNMRSRELPFEHVSIKRWTPINPAGGFGISRRNTAQAVQTNGARNPFQRKLPKRSLSQRALKTRHDELDRNGLRPRRRKGARYLSGSATSANRCQYAMP